MTTPTARPDVAQLRADFGRLYANCAAIGKRSAEIRERLPRISDELLPVAIANGDGRVAELLRAERASLEAEFRDLEKAEGVASARADLANQELARAEVPGLLADLTKTTSEYRKALVEVQRIARLLVDQRRNAQNRFNLGIGDTTSALNPERIKVGSGLGIQILRALGDMGDLPE